MAEPPHELHERAEGGHSEPDLAPVSVTMAILAVLIAAVSLFGFRSHDDEILAMTKATDQWSYYQAKDTRQHTYEILLDLSAADESPNNPKAAEVRKKYAAEIDRYKKQGDQIQSDARSLEQQAENAGRRGDRLDVGEGFLEAALVVASLTILTRRKAYWFGGILLGIVGVGVALSSFLIR